MIDPGTMHHVQLKQSLSPHQLAILESEMNRQRKDPLTAILLAVFLGCFGAHQFYMNRSGLGITMLVITILGIPLAFLLIGFFMIAAMWIWALISCFTLGNDCERYNRELEVKLIASLTSTGDLVPVRL